MDVSSVKQVIAFIKSNYNLALLSVAWLGLGIGIALRRGLDLPRRAPRLSPWLAWLWAPAILSFGITAALRYRNDQFDEWYIFFVYGVTAAVLWSQRDYRPAPTLLLALLPPTLHRIIALGQAMSSYQLRAPYKDYFIAWDKLDVFWVLVLIVVAVYQKRLVTKEEAQRKEEARLREQVAAHNAELERLVAERTAALTHQSEELQTALSELRTTQAQLIQSEKMASLGELTAGIAHEIQNPLNFVNNFADVSAELVTELEEEQARPERDAGLEDELLADLKQNLHKITEHGQRAASIVKGMLAHSRQSTGERQPTDVNALCDEYLRLAYHGLRAKDKSFNATLQPVLAPILPLVPAAPGDLGRVLLNLFTNAFYAVQKRQQAGEPDYAPTVSVRTRRVGDEVEIAVRDNGTGIPAEVQQKIFQPFFTTKPTGEGTGLGLSLSHDIVVQGHGGTLEVESAEGEFTEFTIRLPFREE